MDKIRSVRNRDDLIRMLSAALHHEWAVSFEYVIHAYSMPKGKFLYDDPVLKQTTDARSQTIQIGIDEMYHALQLGVTLARLGVDPGFGTDEVVRFPLVADNLRRDKTTEEMVTDLYQSAEIAPGAFPEVENMVWNISYDEVRHIAQFEAMIAAIEAGGTPPACFATHPGRSGRQDLQALHALCRLENEAMHRYLRYVIMFNAHQDLSQRLFKNSVNHMRHWDKLAGILVRLSDVVAIENAVADEAGVERSRQPMPVAYPGEGRLSALETLPGLEREILAGYEGALGLGFPQDIQAQLGLHLALTREHVFTQDKLLGNARRIKGVV
jgi:bacterioferritin (cytochrome b1)